MLSDGKEQRDSELNRLLHSGILEPVRDDLQKGQSISPSGEAEEEHVVNPQ